MPRWGKTCKTIFKSVRCSRSKGTQTLNTLGNSLFGKIKICAEYLLKRSGPMSMSPSQLGAFTRSDPARPHANLEYHVQPLEPGGLWRRFT